MPLLVSRTTPVDVSRLDPSRQEFIGPVPELLEHVRAVLNRLGTFSGKGRRASGRKVSDAAAKGTLEHVVEVLRSILETDFATNQKEAAKEGWQFDYLVECDESGKSVEILTRIYSPARPGAILYGRVVERDGANSYLLWSDD